MADNLTEPADVSPEGVPGKNLGAGAGLSAFEVDVIDLFVGVLRLIGIPKSIGEIYGLLYACPEPLALDEIVGRLQISKGSASQGLRFLRKVGAVQPTYVAGDRRDHYEAVVELKQLVAGFIREELMPHLENGQLRLARLQEHVEAAGPENGDFVRSRVGRLQTWHRRAGEILPVANTFLD